MARVLIGVCVDGFCVRILVSLGVGGLCADSVSGY